jgi:hypothetical protein
MFAIFVVVMGAGFALMVAHGFRKQSAPAPVQPVVRSLPRVQPDFALGPLPVEEVEERAATPRVDRAALEQPQMKPVPVPVQVQRRPDAQNEAVAAAQRLEDAMLLQQQEAASQRQQEELDQEIEQELKTQQEMEAEPRIQDIPEIPMEQAPPEPTQPQ